MTFWWQRWDDSLLAKYTCIRFFIFALVQIVQIFLLLISWTLFEFYIFLSVCGLSALFFSVFVEFFLLKQWSL